MTAAIPVVDVPALSQPQGDAAGVGAEIACRPSCATTQDPARCRPISGDRFLLSRLSPTLEKSGLGAQAAEKADA